MNRRAGDPLVGQRGRSVARRDADVGSWLTRVRPGWRPRVLLTLGSGLARMAEAVDEPSVCAFADVGLASSAVEGHAGRLVAGDLAGVPVLVQQGRLHLYEGHAATDVVAVVRAAAAAGADTFVVTNAAGGLREHQRPGDLVILRDHLNLTGASPLIGTPSFVDMGQAYDPQLFAAARAVAEGRGQTLAPVVYAGVTGPAYETPAEVAMLRAVGADAVGMSTVLEVIAARAADMRVLGLSVLTNVHGAASPTSHAQVLASADEAAERLTGLLTELAPRLR